MKVDAPVSSASLPGMIERTKQPGFLTHTKLAPETGFWREPAKPQRITLTALVAMLLALVSLQAATPIPSDSDFVVSLNGPWRFRLEQANGPSKRPAAFTQKYPLEIPATFEAFYATNYTETRAWHDLKVPGNWEMAGYSPATYYQADNACGFYRKTFVVPESWRGRQVKVNFDGVQNTAEIWLNGQPVNVSEPSWGRPNYHESGWTAWQADLTPWVKFGQTNLLALRVCKNSKSVDCDMGDYFFLGGVYRPVTLFSVPATHIADFAVRTHLLADGRAEVKTLVSLAGESPAQAKISVRLEGESVISGTADAQGRVELTQVVAHPRLWSAEFPNLYPLELALADGTGQCTERLNRQVGIREVTITNGLLLVNGTLVKLTGICRHDVSATEGTAVGPELWTKDLKLMKAANINAIRCSHYPYGSGFYDLCDQLGFYVLGELPYCWVGPPTMVTNCPGGDPALTPAFEQRARETVLRDQNHPSIIVWGIGNENYGPKPLLNLQRAADLTGQLDPTRPRLVSGCLADKYHVEMDDCHYPTLQMTRDHIRDPRRARWPLMYSEHPNVYDVRRGADYGALDLWAAVMTRTWSLIWDCDSIPGSFLWEWQDRAVADKCKTKLNDFDPTTGVSYVKNKGLVDGWRNPRPDYYAVKMEYAPIQVGRQAELLSQSGAVGLTMTNRYSFTDLSFLEAQWQLLRQGASLAQGTAHLPLAPRSRGQVSLPLPAPALRQAPDTLRLAFNDPRGWNVVTYQFELVKPNRVSIAGTPLPKGLPFPRLNLVSETQTHDPNKHLSTERFSASLRNVKVEPADCTGEALREVKALEADVLLHTDPPQIVGHVRAHFADGIFQYQLHWTGPDTWVQELGWIFEMPNAYNRFSWKREALWSYYPDTHIGRAAGTALPDSANGAVTRIDRPDQFDFNSSKYHCQWASLTDARGRGLCVEFGPEAQYAVRGGFGENGSYTLVVNQQASPPRENNIIPDFVLELKKGNTVEGSFRVGSRK